MKNNKGQALVEFIIILPIFLMLILSIIDLGNIISKKYSLQNDIDLISDMYKNEEYVNINNYVNDKNITISYRVSDDFVIINLKKDVNVISPLLNIILGRDYEINVEKSMYNE